MVSSTGSQASAVWMLVQYVRWRPVARSSCTRCPLADAQRDVVQDGGGQDELGRLAQEFQRVLEDDLMNQRFRMAAPAHLHGKARDRDWIARAPVAGAGDADAIRTVFLDDVDRALRRD